LPGQEPAHLPWEALGIDLVLECTGLNADRSAGQAHLDAGSRRILFSQPATPDMDITVIHGFNHEAIRSSHRILSAGSCTTNCLLPLLDILQASFGFRHGTATTLHAAMNDQPVTDTLHSNSLRLTRAALNGMVPVDTALARGITRLKPELEGRIDCTHLRLPTTAVSAMDITVVVEQPTTRAAVEQALTDAASGAWRDRLGVCDDPVSSVDFAHDPRSGIVDLTQIRVVDDRVVKLLCWFDKPTGWSISPCSSPSWINHRGGERGVSRPPGLRSRVLPRTGPDSGSQCARQGGRAARERRARDPHRLGRSLGPVQQAQAAPAPDAGAGQSHPRDRLARDDR
jgi:D-erythrose 4-phosphate dehydrogenase